MQGGEGDGGQAEFVRVPQADGTMFKITGSDFSDEPMASLLALTDVMATGYHAAVSGFESHLPDHVMSQANVSRHPRRLNLHQELVIGVFQAPGVVRCRASGG